MAAPIATPAEMLAEAASIEAGTHPLFQGPAMLRRLAAKTLRDRAATLSR